MKWCFDHQQLKRKMKNTQKTKTIGKRTKRKMQRRTFLFTSFMLWFLEHPNKSVFLLVWAQKMNLLIHPVTARGDQQKCLNLRCCCRIDGSNTVMTVKQCGSACSQQEAAEDFLRSRLYGPGSRRTTSGDPNTSVLVSVLLEPPNSNVFLL